MRGSRQARNAAKSLYQSCLVDGLLDEGRCRQAVDEIVSSKPRGYLVILDHFQRLVRLDVVRRTARVESALALDPEHEEKIKGSLTERYGPGLQFEFLPQPGLLGGVRVRVGSDVFDASVKGRLVALEQGFFVD